MNIRPATWTLALLLAGTCAFDATAQRTIEDIAPSKSVLVVGADDMARSVAQFKQTPLWEMLESRELREAFGDAFDQFDELRAQFEQELGLDDESLALPGGAVGFAAFLAPDEDLGFDTMGFIAIADFRGQRDLLEQGFDAVLKRLRDDGAEIDEFELDGRQYYAFDLSDDDDADQDFDDADFPFMMGDPFAGTFAGMERMFVSRTDETVLMGSNLAVLRDAFAALEGHPIESVRNNPLYRDARGMIGRGDVHMVVLVDGVVDVANMNPMMMFVGPMLGGPLRALGFDGIKAIGMMTSFDRPDLVMHQRTGVLIDGRKRGVVGLFDHSTAIADVPGFVRDASGYTRLNFQFDGLMNVINDVVASIPAEMRHEVDGFMLEFGPDIHAMFSSLGPDVHMIGDLEEPLFAIRLTNPGRFESVLTKYAPMAQLEPREFVGHTIFSSPFMPAAIGLGGGYAVIGPTEGVEDLLRIVGDGGRGFADDPQFEAARAMLGDGAVIAWGYSDSAAAFDAARGMGDQFNPMPGGMRGMGGGDIPDLSFMKEYIGPSVWALRSHERGFIMDGFTLRPVDNN